MKNRNVLARIEMVKSMDTIIRNLNNEDMLDRWFSDGVADHDEELDEEELYLYADDDESFADLMRLFQCIIHNDWVHDGGFYVDGVVS